MGSTVGIAATRGAWVGVISISLPNGVLGWAPRRELKLHAVDWSIEISLSSRVLVLFHHGQAVRGLRPRGVRPYGIALIEHPVEIGAADSDPSPHTMRRQRPLIDPVADGLLVELEQLSHLRNGEKRIIEAVAIHARTF